MPVQEVTYKKYLVNKTLFLLLDLFIVEKRPGDIEFIRFAVLLGLVRFHSLELGFQLLTPIDTRCVD